MDVENENERIKEVRNELASLIFSLNLAITWKPIEEYVQLEREKNVDAKYNMAELVYVAWDREIHFGLELGPNLKEPT